MKSYLISDNEDTRMGMRLAGVEGEILESKQEILHKIDNLIANPEIGIIMITGKIFEKAKSEIMNLKRTVPETLIVKIPGTSETEEGTHLDSYIRESIGLDF